MPRPRAAYSPLRVAGPRALKSCSGQPLCLKGAPIACSHGGFRHTRTANRLPGGATVALAYVTPGPSSRVDVTASRRKTRLPDTRANHQAGTEPDPPQREWTILTLRRVR